MKSKTAVRFAHRFDLNSVAISMAEGVQLNLPLGLVIDGQHTEFRRWRVHQGSAVARRDRGGGFVSVDFRKEGYFHWRGILGPTRALGLTPIHEADVVGWQLRRPDVSKPISIGHDTTLAYTVSATDGMEAMPLGPRFIYFEKPGEQGSGWMVSCPGPSQGSGVEFRVERGSLSVTLLDFDNRANDGHFEGPYVAPGLSSLDEAFDLHRQLTGKEGYLRAGDRGRAWWQRPTLYLDETWMDDHARLDHRNNQRELLQSLSDLAKAHPFPTASLADTAILALDGPWHDAHGDYNPYCPGLFKGMEAYSEFRQALLDGGHKLLLSFDPFLMGTNSRLSAESPWAILQHLNGGALPSSGGDFFIDYTHPGTKEYVEDRVAYLLADDEEALGADGLLLGDALGAPNKWAQWTDPEDGSGEALWARVLQHVASAARAVRPDSLIEVTGSDPLASRWAGRRRTVN